MTLSDAIIEGNLSEVESHLKKGGTINYLDEYGFTPLIQAAIVKNNDIAVLLLKAGARVDIVDASGQTALHWAIDHDNNDLVQMLLKQGANPNSYTAHGQPALFYPILRGRKPLINMLIQHGADINFAKDYINAKLIGHRYELQGLCNIVNANGAFIEIDLEGFYLEFTIDIIRDSLIRFLNSYEAHRMRLPENEIQTIIQSFKNASYLREYKHYSKVAEQHRDNIQELIKMDLLLLPVSYRGHAITIVKHGDFLAKCDRGVKKMTDPIVINTMGQQAPLNLEFYMSLLYKRQTDRFLKTDLYNILDLHPFVKLPITHQITGNCSWANVEASVPTMLFMLLYDKAKQESSKEKMVTQCMDFYKTWGQWDKDRSLEDWVLDFDKATFTRQKSKCDLMGSILFQACNPQKQTDITRAKRILTYLMRPHFKFVLRSYCNVYLRGSRTPPEGRRFKALLDACGVDMNSIIQ